jgi:TonB-linked SusC/RagA family outer membrane protein
VNDRFTVRSSMQLGSEVHQRIVNDNTIDGVVTNAIANQPYVPVRLPNGDFTSPDDGLDYSNAVAIGTLNSNETRTYRGLGNVEGIVTLSSAFRLNGRVGFDLQNLRDLSWESPHIIGTYAAGVDGVAEYGSTTAHRYLTEAYGTYDFARGMINQLQVVVGAGAEWNSYENSYLRGEGYATDDFRYPGNAATVTTYAAGKSGHNLVSAFSRANLNVLDRYLLTASIRTDGSSRFGERNRYGVFPAISAGWLLTSESFGAPLRRIGDIKLRASYGLTGNQGISDDFASLGRFGRANYAGEAGIAQSSLGNPDLRWEQTAEFDVGFDVEMFRGRVSLIADYYRKLTSDLLVQRPITSTSGLTSVWENVGNIENKGFELGLTTVNIESPVRGGLRWETSLNVSTLDNKVTKLFRNEPFNTGIRSTNRVEVGQPLGAYHVLDFTGVDPATGDAKYRDVNGDGTVNSEDRIIAGSPHPDYWGGFRNTLTWKGFDVMAFFQFSQGNKIFNAIRIFADDGGYYNDNKFKNVLNRWQKPGDITNEPRASWDGASDARRVSDRYIEDGSYVRFQEITVGYRVPDDLAAVTRLSNVRVYVSGVNIHTWTDFSGYSPDVNSNGSGSNISLGTEFYAYPLARTIRAGVSASW